MLGAHRRIVAIDGYGFPAAHDTVRPLSRSVGLWPLGPIGGMWAIHAIDIGECVQKLENGSVECKGTRQIMAGSPCCNERPAWMDSGRFSVLQSVRRSMLPQLDGCALLAVEVERRRVEELFEQWDPLCEPLFIRVLE